jgi:predicted GNAT family N-acyltransferase
VQDRPNIRVLTTVAELTSAFQLRYTIYRDLGYLTNPGADGLEIDAYDARAYHLGAFESDGELVATTRFITQRRILSTARCLDRVVSTARDPELRAAVAGAPALSLPAICSPELAAALKEVAGTRPICELSRVVVRPGYRARGLYQSLFALGAALCRRSEPAVIVGSCHPDHVPLWARCGFARLPGAGEYTNPSVLRRAVCIFVDSMQLPPTRPAHLEALRSYFAATGNRCIPMETS